MIRDLSKWKGCDRPGLTEVRGTHACLEPYDCAEHLQGLFEAVGGAANADLWTYMPIGPFEDTGVLADLLARANASHGWQTMVIRAGRSGNILGMASYMRIRKAHGSAEVGAVAFNHKLQRSTIATDAMYLMAKHVFDDLGYRRYEWKCNDANQASKRAAIRFGFQFEGIFRNDLVMKGQNRDTAWYSMIDAEWPDLKAAFTAWLAAENFDAEGRQLQKLESFRQG